MHAPRFDLTQDHATPAHSAVPAGGFIVCPMGLWPYQSGAAAWMHEVYRMAHQQALAAVTTSWYDRAVPSQN
jgi:hypothetical protein